MTTKRGRRPGALDLVALQARLPRSVHAALTAEADHFEAAGEIRPSLNSLMVELLNEALAARAAKRATPRAKPRKRTG